MTEIYLQTSIPSCPFCGGRPRMDMKMTLNAAEMILGMDRGNLYRAHCPACHLSMPWVASASEAIASWQVCADRLGTNDGTPIRELTRAQVILSHD